MFTKIQSNFPSVNYAKVKFDIDASKPRSDSEGVSRRIVVCVLLNNDKTPQSRVQFPVGSYLISQWCIFVLYLMLLVNTDNFTYSRKQEDNMFVVNQLVYELAVASKSKEK